MSPRGRSALAPIFNRTYLSKLEKAASYPGAEIIAKLATVLEVEPAELIRLPPPQPKSDVSSVGLCVVSRGERLRSGKPRHCPSEA